MRKHIDTKHPVIPKGIIQREQSVELKKKVKFYCDQCDFSCTNKKSLKKHSEQGHVEASFKIQKTCNECDFKYICENEIEEHMKLKHIKDPNHSTIDFDDYPEVEDAELDEWIAKAAENKT